MADKQDWRREDEDEGEQEVDENVSLNDTLTSYLTRLNFILIHS
jgi:hypothetical protein